MHLVQRRLIAPKLFYFCWFAAMGIFSPYIGLYYRAAGLDLSQIGLLVALAALLQIVAAPLWGLIADALRIHRVLLPVAVAGTLLPVMLIGRTSAFALLLPLAALLALFTAPVSALADSATLALLGAQRSRYGAQRVWGSVGWGISTLLAGALVQSMGLGITFPGYLIVGALAAGASALLPRAQLPQADLRLALGRLVRDVRWARFLICIFLIGCCNSAVNSFLTLYLQDLGAGGAQIGIAIALGSVSELPVMVFAPLVLRRWGARPLLIAAALLYALRTAIYVFAPGPGWALAAQLLHGPSFAALWTGGVDEAHRLAPAGLEVTAQSLFGTVCFGVATVFASAVGGWMYRDLGYAALFGAGSIAALLGGLGLVLSPRTRDIAPEQPVIIEQRPDAS